jgi:hypothetical protein
MIPKRVPKKLSCLVDHWDDERKIGNGIILMIKSGYRWEYDDHGLHVMGFDNVSDAIESLRYVVSCDCEVCK